MDFDANFAVCIRDGHVQALKSLGITEDMVNDVLICDIAPKSADPSRGFPIIRCPTPLVFAICCGQEDMALALIGIGASVTQPVVGWHPIHFAVFANMPRVVARILEKEPAEIKAVTEDAKATPLHIAITADSTIPELIAAGADVNVVNSEGNTPLHGACALLRDHAVRLLMAHGADVGKQNGQGLTPADVARAVGNGNALKIIENPPQAVDAGVLGGNAENGEEEDMAAMTNELLALAARVDKLAAQVAQMQ